MIAVLMLSATSGGLLGGLSDAEQHRIVVYVMAGIVGLAVTALISAAKAARRRKAARKIVRNTAP